MTEQTKKRDGLLARMLGREDAAQKIREAADAITDELEEQGVEHKEQFTLDELRALVAGLGDDLQRALHMTRQAQTSAASKATITVDDLTELVMIASKQLEGVPDDQVRDVITKFLAEALGDDTLDIEMSMFAGGEEKQAGMDDDDDDDDEDEDEDKEKERKYRLDLMEQLVNDQGEIAEMLGEYGAALTALKAADLPGTLAKFEERLAAMEKQLRQRPRQASEDDSTVLDLGELVDAVRKSNLKTTTIAGLKVYDHVPGSET
jgi:hypothetical protein